MELINYYNLTNVQHAMFVKFLQECHNEISQPAHVNMYSFDWETKNNTLLYILEKTDRFFKNGEYYRELEDKVIRETTFGFPVLKN